jgi:hypothetical protein
MKLWKSCRQNPGVRKMVFGGLGVALVSAVTVRPAHSQFGIDIAAILAGLQEINSTLNSAVVSPLKAINQVGEEERQFQQNVLYPISAINNAKQMAASFTNSFTSFRQLGTLNISSATLPNPQQLEQQMLSGNPNNISSISTSYQNVFSPLPAQTAVPQNIEYQIDMGDAQAQDAIKKGHRVRRFCSARAGGCRSAQSADSGVGCGDGADSRCRG